MTSAGTDNARAPDEATASQATTVDHEAADGGSPDRAAAPLMRRLHPLTPFLRSWRLVGGASAVGLSIFRDDLNRLLWVLRALHGDLQLSLVAKAAAVTLSVVVVIVFGAWLSWRATGFAIVDDVAGPGTLLFNRGVLAKQRSKVRLLRVQSVDINRPLVPRLLGLAAVRLDMAAGDEASVDLAYLPLQEAMNLREEILRHMSGRPTRQGVGGEGADLEGPSPTAPEPDILVARVTTEQVIKSNLLDGVSAWVVFVVWVAALVVAAVWMGWEAVLAAVSGIIPVSIAIAAQLRRQVVSMMRDADFALYRTATGVRITSGLTSTVNRTVDFDRIQAVRLVEPFLWRKFGWARVKMDIAGGSSDFEAGASLIPVASRAQALDLVAAVTGARLDSPPYVAAGAGARRVDPLGWRFLGVALLEAGAVSRAGRWRRSTAYVPYARVQSVSARQGPLQRWLGLATVLLDLPKGSQRWVASHRGVDDAAELVTGLAVRAKQHRLDRRDPPWTVVSEPAGDPRKDRRDQDGDYQDPYQAPPRPEDRPRQGGEPADEYADHAE